MIYNIVPQTDSLSTTITTTTATTTEFVVDCSDLFTHLHKIIRYVSLFITYPTVREEAVCVFTSLQSQTS